jgi:2-polyprenyl-6-methoxyphenol hydroxylase-like FAD-dependent oxidoreductase
MKTDVLIVGAGPTGLALACQLIRYGVDFVILDRKETTTPFSKAIGVQARTLEIYEQIDLAEDLIALGAKAQKARLVVGGKVRGEVDFSEIGTGMSDYPYVLIVEQGRHEKLLYDFIRAREKDVRWQTTLEDFSQTEAGVTASVKNAAGDAETIEARFLVGCDGAKSPVRHALGLTFEGSTFERMFYVADVRIDWNFANDALMVFLMKNNLLAFFPMVGANRWRIVGTFPEEFAGDEGEVLYEEIEAQIKKDSEIELDITQVNWFSTYKVHTRHVNRFSNGRCFLAGDAAHIHTPAGAQGMNTGIQDAYNLAWKLAFVLKEKASTDILETYNAERLENAENLLKTTDRFFNLVASPEPITSYLRTHVFPYVAGTAFSLDAVRRFVFPRISQIGINYRKSTLGAMRGAFKVKPGDRFPFITVDGASLYERLKAPKFHLLTFFDGENKPAEFAGNNFTDSLELPLYPNVTEIFGTTKTFCVLVRPDNYIGLITEDLSGDDINAYFGKF